MSWHELARHGIAIRGPALTISDIWTDDAVLRAFTHGNLTSYWASVAEALVAHPAEAGAPEAAASAYDADLAARAHDTAAFTVMAIDAGLALGAAAAGSPGG